MRNRPENVLWALERIKEASQSPKGCTLYSTGGFIAEGHIDDLIDLVKEQIKKVSKSYHPIKDVVAKSEVKAAKNKPRWFDSYWSEKGLKKNE